MATPAAWQDPEYLARLRRYSEPLRLADRAFANPCLYCGLDEYEVPYEDTEEHRATSEHQWAVYDA